MKVAGSRHSQSLMRTEVVSEAGHRSTGHSPSYTTFVVGHRSGGWEVFSSVQGLANVK